MVGAFVLEKGSTVKVTATICHTKKEASACKGTESMTTWMLSKHRPNTVGLTFKTLWPEYSFIASAWADRFES